MPPASLHDTRRAKSSTSDYSVTEFPDDAACLEHLWRTRHAPDGDHAHCPNLDEYSWRYDNRYPGQRSMFHALVREVAQQ